VRGVKRAKLDLKVIARVMSGGVDGYGSSGFYARAGEINKLEDLKGKVIAVNALDILISRNASIRWFFDPLVSIGLPMPKIALLPVFMLWFGLFDLSKILMVAFSASFQIIIATSAATQSI